MNATTDTGHRAGQPGPAPSRLAAVDTLRGFALFGILMVNITWFSPRPAH
ncbi:hypothetical protein [Streptomyces djakartensis]